MMRPLAWLVGVGLAMAGVVGCPVVRSDFDDEARNRREAQRALNEYFGALEAKACDRLIAVVTPALSNETCHETRLAFEQHGAHLVDVASWSRDGRDQESLLITVRLRRDNRERQALFRLENHNGEWRVRS